MTYQDALARISAALQFGINPSLEPVRDACARLGDPQKCYRVIQVAGTNGKTSVARMCSAILTAHGLRTGHYLSPHLEEYTERFVVDGEEITTDAFAAALAKVLPATESVERERGQAFTEFELLTVMAFQHFADAGCDAVVLEVGLGGRWDATTVADPEVAVITSITLDHTDRLGADEASIAAEKAEIIKAGGKLLVGRVGPDARSVIAAKAAGAGVPVRTLGEDFHVAAEDAPYGFVGFSVTTPGGSFPGMVLPTAAPYQLENAALAIAAAEWLLEGDGGGGGGARLPATSLDPLRVAAALETLEFPGRMERLSDEPALILDGAHNPDAAARLAEALAVALPGRHLVFVLGIMADKDVAGILDALAPVAHEVICTKNWSPRCLHPVDLARMCEERGLTTRVEMRLTHACERALEQAGEDGAVVVTGSLYTAGEARTWWRTRVATAGGG
jgi:dihydrofolate synthase/folylpolyglutamate synthase